MNAHSIRKVDALGPAEQQYEGDIRFYNDNLYYCTGTAWKQIGFGDAEAGSVQGYVANYGGTTPTPTPTGELAIAVDTSDGHLWWWYDGQWN